MSETAAAGEKTAQVKGETPAPEKKPPKGPSAFDLALETAFKDDQFSVNELEVDSSIQYLTDSNGNILPPATVFDGQEVCFLLRSLIQRPKENWVRRVPHGVLILLSSLEGSVGKTQVPQFLSVTQCLETLSSLIRNTMGIFPPADQDLVEPLAPIEKRTPGTAELEFFSWSMETLEFLQRLCPPGEALLAHSQPTRVTMRYIAFRVLTETTTWFEHAERENKGTYQEHQFALNAFIRAASLINSFAEMELSLATQCGSNPANPPYSFLWMDALMIPVYSGWCLQYLTQSTVLATRHPVSLEDESATNDDSDVLASGITTTKRSIDLGYWACVSEAATLFYHLCFCDQFVKVLVSQPQAEHLMQVLDTVLRIPTNRQAHIEHAKYHLLRVLAVLAENEDPYFLDYACKMRPSSTVAQCVAQEASHILYYITQEEPLDASVATSVATALEALRVAELLSYDSNFVKLVTEHLSQFVLEYLSEPTPKLLAFFESEHAFIRNTTALVFHMIANMHCYSPQISPPDQKNLLINKSALYFTTIFAVNPEGELYSTNRILIGNVATNLWVLFQKVTEEFKFTMSEIDLWRSFIGELQKKIDLIFPPPAILYGTTTAAPPVAAVATPTRPRPQAKAPRAKRRRTNADQESSDEYKTDSDNDEDEELEDDADEFVLAAPIKAKTIKDSLPKQSSSSPIVIDNNAPTSSVLQGVIACFGVVPDPAGLKQLITNHGGSVIGYVTKSVTHVICGHDSASVDASASKIQSAATKQAPVVSENLVHESIAAGKLLSERSFLLSNHPYVRRINTK